MTEHSLHQFGTFNTAARRRRARAARRRVAGVRARMTEGTTHVHRLTEPAVPQSAATTG